MSGLEPIVAKLSGDPANDDNQRTISEAISADHGAIDLYAENIKTASTLQEKIEWRNQFTWALARHAVSEELTLYPVMEKKLGQEGKELADVDREQHMAVSVLCNNIKKKTWLTATRSRKTSTNSKTWPLTAKTSSLFSIPS